LTGIWLLSMVVLINAYSGVLTSLLTAPRLKPIALTLHDVAESQELRVTVALTLHDVAESQELRVTVEKDSYFSRIFLVLLVAVVLLLLTY